MEKCSNCGALFSGKYCNTCGQEKVTERLQTGYLIKQAVHGIFHWESSIFYTFYELLIRPGEVISNYIKGRRKPYVKPIAYFIFIQALYVLTILWISSVKPEKNFSAFNIISYGSNIESENTQIHNVVNSTVKYYIFVVPLLFAVFLKLYTSKQNNLNYAESAVFSFYAFGNMLVFQIITLLASLYIESIWNAGFILIYIYLSYVIINFSGYRLIKGILTGALIIVSSLISFQILMAVFQFVYFTFFFHPKL